MARDRERRREGEGGRVMLIRIDPNGAVAAIGDAAALGIEGVVTRRRASHVEPCNVALRWAFRLIRRHVADTSRLAGFTRRWRCNWRVDLAPSDGPVIGPFRDRSAAIAAASRS